MIRNKIPYKIIHHGIDLVKSITEFHDESHWHTHEIKRECHFPLINCEDTFII